MNICDSKVAYKANINIYTYFDFKFLFGSNTHQILRIRPRKFCETEFYRKFVVKNYIADFGSCDFIFSISNLFLIKRCSRNGSPLKNSDINAASGEKCITTSGEKIATSGVLVSGFFEGVPLISKYRLFKIQGIKFEPNHL